MWQGVTNTIFAVLSAMLISCSGEARLRKVSPSVTGQEVVTQSTAGAGISLVFSIVGDTDVVMLVHNVSGASLLQPEVQGNELRFSWPAELCRRAGEAKWSLVHHGKVLSRGEIYIQPAAEATNAEAYLGPKRIRAGSVDSSMLVVLPTDTYDNLLNEPVALYANLLGSAVQQRMQVPVAGQVGILDLSAPETSGRLILGVEAGTADLPQMELDIHSNELQDFEVYTDLTHPFADGHEQFRIATSKLRDRFGNLVEDGTLVEFLMRKKQGTNLRKAYGLAVQGEAEVRMLHPSEPGTWHVVASCLQAKTATASEIQFLPAVQSYQLAYDSREKTLLGGPFKSFMGQQVPEGGMAQVLLRDNDGTLHELSSEISGNRFSLALNKELLPPGSYQVLVNVGGRQETIAIEL